MFVFIFALIFYLLVTMEAVEVPVIEITDRTWNDRNIAATLDLMLPPKVIYSLPCLIKMLFVETISWTNFLHSGNVHGFHG